MEVVSPNYSQKLGVRKQGTKSKRFPARLRYSNRGVAYGKALCMSFKEDAHFDQKEMNGRSKDGVQFTALHIH